MQKETRMVYDNHCKNPREILKLDMIVILTPDDIWGIETQ